MTKQEKRACRRKLINFYLHRIALKDSNNFHNPHFILHDLKFLVRNGEVYRYGKELQAYK